MNTRARVLATIQRQPGLHISGLARQLDLGWGSVRHHVAILQQEDAVRIEKDGSRAFVYPANTRNSDAARLRLLHDDTSRRIATILARAPGLQMRDLERDLGLARRTIRRHLERLIASGLVQRDPLRPRCFVPQPRLAAGGLVGGASGSE